MTSFWFEVIMVIALIILIAELSTFKRTYAKVESAKMEQREKEFENK